MRLVSHAGGFGRVEGDQIIPMGTDILAFLATGESDDGAPLALADTDLLAPIPAPGKILCIGLNYRDHAAEGNVTVPDEPPLFAKFGNSVIGPDEEIVVPPLTDKPDFEAELGVVIGREARSVTTEDALSYVAGYTCLNDVSARDLQKSNAQWIRGKAIDTFLPMGPWIVTADEISDPQKLAIKCRLNDASMQDASTSLMVWTAAEIISFLSQTIALAPGDVIATGTPAGIGAVRKPPVWLQDGDVVEVEIEGIGKLRNRVRRTEGASSS
jgi:2-keto-4-pentenoate hydratase/2-oxohepta-3-ene-1,7-dioic acid hydratase in catechol pathway